MTVFLTPDGEPFFGGTYFPPEPRHGLPSFRQVLTAVSRRVPRAARRRLTPGAGARRRRSRSRPSSQPVERSAHRSMLGEATRALARQFDREWGGWGGAPKFPPASTLEFLLRMHLRGDEEALPMVTQTLDAMAAGGMYDLVGGGFHRYSVDERLARPALREDALRQRAAGRGVPPRLGRDRRRALPRASPRRRSTTCSASCCLPEGGFASAQDADTDGVEGLTFTWTPERRRAARSCSSPSRTGAR